MIHKTAIIDPKAKIGSNVEIGPYCVIGPDVEIGENTIIQSHVNISVSAKIGKGNKIYPFVSINDPQDLKYNGEPTKLIIGDNNKIREYVTINTGTVGGGGKTVIGNNCLFMISSHIAHDCQIGNNVIMASFVGLAGHNIIEDYAILEGKVGTQQFVRIGAHAFVGGASLVRKNILLLKNQSHLKAIHCQSLKHQVRLFPIQELEVVIFPQSDELVLLLMFFSLL